MITPKANRPYDLQQRTLSFAQDVRAFLRRIPVNRANMEDAKQLLRSSGSVGANYIEANDALGKGNFLMHMRISRKESKESAYWLTLLDLSNQSDLRQVRDALLKEAKELSLIFSSIIQNAVK